MKKKYLSKIIILGIALVLVISGKARISSNGNIVLNNEAAKVEAEESNETTEASTKEYIRDEWESSNANQFYDPIRGITVGLKNYKLYLDTNVDITGPDFSYTCPYNGETIYDYTAIEWDHIIPIHYVFEHGGADWTREEKVAYCYDFEVGVNVNKHDNRVKSDKGPSEWLPEINQKWYCEQWLTIADKYNIIIAPEDMEVINEVLSK